MSENLSAAELLRIYAPSAGLESVASPFSTCGSLRDRFAVNPFLMAPMAGVSDAAYRLVARAGGAALAYSEMVSVAGIHYGGEKTWKLAYPADAEPDLAVQLFGSRPEQFREAAAAVSERLGDRLILIDINMACPVPKVTRKGEGAALMNDPENAHDIVRAVVEEASVPVTCKIRRGWSEQEGGELAPEFARGLEQAGAHAIAVHGRYATQLYRGNADWGSIARVAAAVNVPVIGSGDVMDAERACKMLHTTGAAAVMIARGSYGNPWIFSNARRLLAGLDVMALTWSQKIAAFALEVRLIEATGGHLARARSIAGWYLRGMPDAASWRRRAMSCTNIEDYLELCDALMHYLED